MTLGPKGRNAVLDQAYGPPKITKDGVTVAKHIEFQDKFMNMGAQLVRQVANKANDTAGDGTTTATVLTRAIYSEGCKAVAAGMNPMDLRRGIMLAVDSVVESLAALSEKVESKERITQVATISANSEREIGELIADAMERVGKEGVITVNDGKTALNELDVVEVRVGCSTGCLPLPLLFCGFVRCCFVFTSLALAFRIFKQLFLILLFSFLSCFLFLQGMRFDRGYISPYFVTDNKTQTSDFEAPYMLLVEKKVSSLQSLVPILEAVIKENRPLLIVAEDVESEALATLVVNKLRAGIKVCAVKAPGFGDNRKATIQVNAPPTRLG